MLNYSLTTWSNDRMVGYEPVVAASAGEAKAYVQGMITERTRDHTSLLARLGVRYVIEDGHRTLEELSTFSPANALGSWHVVEVSGVSQLVWQPSARLDG